MFRLTSNERNHHANAFVPRNHDGGGSAVERPAGGLQRFVAAGRLAKDPTLSALNIDADTLHGKVTLNGSAPDAAAQMRATQLVQSVKGVTAVDNRLVVKTS